MSKTDKTKKEIGDYGEDKASEYLFNKGYRIITKNFRTKSGEIDIVAIQRNILVFIEVKTRKNDSFCSAREAVTLSKQSKIKKTAKEFIVQNNIPYKEIRFDVIEVYTYAQKIEHYADAF